MLKVLEELAKLDLVAEGTDLESRDPEAKVLSEDFDKFMDNIVLTEHKRRKTTEKELRPAQEYNKRYTELPQNRIRWSK